MRITATKKSGADKILDSLATTRLPALYLEM
jgi:hypothetical protein